MGPEHIGLVSSGCTFHPSSCVARPDRPGGGSRSGCRRSGVGPELVGGACPASRRTRDPPALRGRCRLVGHGTAPSARGRGRLVGAVVMSSQRRRCAAESEWGRNLRGRPRPARAVDGPGFRQPGGRATGRVAAPPSSPTGVPGEPWEWQLAGDAGLCVVRSLNVLDSVLRGSSRVTPRRSPVAKALIR